MVGAIFLVVAASQWAQSITREYIRGVSGDSERLWRNDCVCEVMVGGLGGTSEIDVVEDIAYDTPLMFLALILLIIV